MDQNSIRHHLALALRSAYRAGGEIMKVYATSFSVERKDDDSPLTEADRRAHDIIETDLLGSGLPVLSEEGGKLPFSERSAWENFWMVDPLDGTREFISRNGEFTVNIALIHRPAPLLGVVYAPAADAMYFGGAGLGAWKTAAYGKAMGGAVTDDVLTAVLAASDKLPLPRGDRPFTVVGSRSHPSPETTDFIESVRKERGTIGLLSAGSSLKLCLVAEGKADLYPRFAPTMEWDIAAGQAIVEAAGGRVISRTDGKPLGYNKKDLTNDWFLASAAGV